MLDDAERIYFGWWSLERVLIHGDHSRNLLRERFIVSTQRKHAEEHKTAVTNQPLDSAVARSGASLLIADYNQHPTRRARRSAVRRSKKSSTTSGSAGPSS